MIVFKAKPSQKQGWYAIVVDETKRRTAGSRETACEEVKSYLHTGFVSKVDGPLAP
jgi:hypothetical protein